jgi:hypothetical protein
LAGDFFNWFNLSESGQSLAGPSLACAQLQPGGLQQFIDLSFLLDSQDVVVRGVVGGGYPRAAGADPRFSGCCALVRR